VKKSEGRTIGFWYRAQRMLSGDCVREMEEASYMKKVERGIAEAMEER
jgi:hypothetical protein